jgi:hypothetical protein
MVSIPSKTFKSEYKTQLALRLVANAPAETQDTIRQEILDGVEAEEDMRALMMEPDGDEGAEDMNGDGRPKDQAGGRGGSSRGGAGQARTQNSKGAAPS